MDAAERTADLIGAGLDSLGVEADDVELAVMAAADAVFSPAILDLLSLDTDDVVPERNPDLSREP